MEFEGICIMTSDVNRLARFYCELFDTTSEGNDVHTTMKIGTLGLAIWRPDNAVNTSEKRMKELRKKCYSLIFSSQDVDETYGQAKELGAVIQKPLTDQPWGKPCIRTE